MPFGEISNSPSATVEDLRLSSNPCGQDARFISHSAQ
jgi:hypothetical protein